MLMDQRTVDYVSSLPAVAAATNKRITTLSPAEQPMEGRS